MATNAQTLLSLAAANKEPGLSDHDVLMCLAGYYGTQAGLNAQQALNLAEQEKYSTLDDRTLEECLLAAIS